MRARARAAREAWFGKAEMSSSSEIIAELESGSCCTQGKTTPGTKRLCSPSWSRARGLTRAMGKMGGCCYCRPMRGVDD